MSSPNQNNFRQRLTRWLLIGIGLVVVVAALVLVIQSGVQRGSLNAVTPSAAELTQTMAALSEEAEAFYMVATALDMSLGNPIPFPDGADSVTATPPANP
jgi:hypothetical protein